jgi:hypothetical protein
MQYGGGCTAVKDGLRRSARKGRRRKRRRFQHEQWVSSLAPARGGGGGGRGAAGEGPLEKKEAMQVAALIFLDDAGTPARVVRVLAGRAKGSGVPGKEGRWGFVPLALLLA